MIAACPSGAATHRGFPGGLRILSQLRGKNKHGGLTDMVYWTCLYGRGGA